MTRGEDSVRLLFFARLERIEGFLHQLAAQVFLVLGRQLGVAGDMDNASSQNDPIGADHLGYGQSGSDLNHRDAGFFQFSCDRSAAARARPSRRSEDHRIDSLFLYLLGHLPAEPARVRQRIGAATGG